MIAQEMTSTEARLNMAGNFFHSFPLLLLKLKIFSFLRLLYRILNNSVDAQKYSVNDVSWSRNLLVHSFVFNTKGIDDRHSSEKIRNPMVLDIGICDATTPSLMPGTPTHLIDAANALLGGKKGKKTVGFSSISLFQSP